MNHLNLKSKIEVERQLLITKLDNGTFKINLLFDLLEKFPGKQENVAKTKFSCECEKQQIAVKLYFVF